MRDSQSLRARPENRTLGDAGLNEQANSGRLRKAVRPGRTSTWGRGSKSGNGSGSGSLGKPGPRNSRPGSINDLTRRTSLHSRRWSKCLSPIILVEDQETTGPFYRPGRISPNDRCPKGSGKSADTSTTPRSTSPSLPYSKGEGVVQRLATRTSPKHRRNIAIGPGKQRQQSFLSKEADLVARINAMERKNTRLESALLALLQSSTSVDGAKGEKRMSALSII